MHDSDTAPTLADPIRAGQKTSAPAQKTSAPAQKTASPAAAQGRAGRKTPAQNTAPLAAAKGQTGWKTPARSTAGENLRGETRGVRNRAIQESYGAKPAVKRAKPRRNAAGTEIREKDTAANSARDVAATNSVQNDAAANSAARKKAGASVTGGSSRARKRAADNITAARFAAVIADKNRIYDPVLQKYCETHGMGLLRYTDAENCHFALIDKPALFVVYPGCDSLLCCDTDSASEAADLLAAYFRIPDREAARALFEQIQSMAPARPAK